MKRFVLLLVSGFLSVGIVSAQSKPPAVDQSPLDVSYFPPNFPLLKIQDKAVDPLIARVIYSRPQKNGRALFGDLIEYGKVWRLGANEATEIEFFHPVTIGTTKVKKGRYTLLAIPDPVRWTIILNKETDTWGSFRYDSKKDILRTETNVVVTPEEMEAFTMYFDKTTTGANLIITWDKMRTSLPIIF